MNLGNLLQLNNLWILCTGLLMVMGTGILLHNLIKNRIQGVKTTLIFMCCWAVPFSIMEWYKLIMAIMNMLK